MRTTRNDSNSERTRLVTSTDALANRATSVNSFTTAAQKDGDKTTERAQKMRTLMLEETLKKLDSKSKSTKIDFAFFKRLFRMFKILLPWPFVNQSSFYLVLFIVLLNCGSAVIQGLLATFASGLAMAVLHKSTDEVISNVIFLSACVGGIVVIATLNAFLSGNINILWRRKLTLHAQRLFMRKRNYYYLLMTAQHIDNPDIRLTDDITQFVKMLTDVLFPFINCSIVIVYMSVQLAMRHWFIPTFIFVCYAVVFVMIRFILSALAKYIYMQEILEGDFRFGHIRLRTSAESIAFLNGEHQENDRLSYILDLLVSNQKAIALRTFLLNSCNQFMIVFSNYINIVIYTLLLFTAIGLYPVIFPSDSTVDDILSITYVLTSLIRSLSFNYNMILGTDPQGGLSKEFAQMTGYCSRVAELLETLESLEKEEDRYLKHIATLQSGNNSAKLSKARGDSDVLAVIDSVSCLTPAGTVLFDGLSMTIKERESVVVMGPSGCGKSSLLRLIGGLWRLTNGRITIVHSHIGYNGMFYLPQRSHMFQGTLRDQITYPSTSDEDFEFLANISDEELLSILDMVNLRYLAERYGGFEEEHDWSSVLSGGEKQRLAMARLFYHKPRFAVLDEATSAVDVDTENQFYRKCEELGITYVSVAHRKSVLRYHKKLLRFEYDTKTEAANQQITGVSAQSKLRIELIDITDEVLKKFNVSPLERENTSIGGGDGDDIIQLDTIDGTVGGGDIVQLDNIERHKVPIIYVDEFERDSDDSEFVDIAHHVKRVEIDQISLIPDDDNVPDVIEKRTEARLAAQTPSEKKAFSWLFVRRFIRLMRIAFRTWRSRVPYMYFTALLLWLLSAAIGQFKSLIESNLLRYLIEQDFDAMLLRLVPLMIAVVIQALFSSTGELLAEYTAAYWRRNLNTALQKRYFRSKNFYKLQFIDRSLDNLDGRITRDVAAFFTAFVSVSGVFVPQILQLIIAAILLGREAWIVPICVLVFSSLMTLLMRLVMQSIAKFIYRQEFLEADLRFSNARLRESVESVAFLNGERQEHLLLNHRLALCVKNAKRVVFRTAVLLQGLVMFVMQSNMYMNYGFMILLVYVPFFAPHWQDLPLPQLFEKITLVSRLTMTLSQCIIAMNMRLQLIATMAGSGTRIAELIETIDKIEAQAAREAELENQNSDSSTPQQPVSWRTNELMRLENVTCVTPDGATLFRDVSFSIEAGKSILITGPSGSGKSSMLRIIGRLWKPTFGKVLSNTEDIFFLPQQSYMFAGKLRDQIKYPKTDADDPLLQSEDSLAEENVVLTQLLRKVNLGYLIDRYSSSSGEHALDKQLDWTSVLSGGEQQRLAMARLFYHCPKLAVLDEATSAVDAEMEAQFYNACKELNITFVSVAHNETLVDYHDYALSLSPSVEIGSRTSNVRFNKIHHK